MLCCVLSLGKYHSGPVQLLTMNDHNILPVEQAGGPFYENALIDNGNAF